ncbi:hypothetical protein JMJ77_0005270 [Colletotrichum scovillei]|uniref:Uncharacterized protein n=1 Tax=Colletotrichum scovillei TaxID=1209932 RepID=A0A9P7RG58_9PEZI|nr:hypothetical protein JMJ77_0005270 [Colletotrichum scovillei]KAG7076495.1 hypothetical protein JMJ76_0013758 [Colletotrichum scovillei]KAG7083622.1 hypothetical protein JMJ78_0009067 [Colletotrichum scovillei]
MPQDCSPKPFLFSRQFRMNARSCRRDRLKLSSQENKKEKGMMGSL